ncbi:MAG: hypothetical protein Q9166_004751 [cf. Caloplaca sp. 2 TL-2023]
MHLSIQTSLLLGALVPFIRTILAAPAAKANRSTLIPRYDYEPGDTLNRTMCFCTSDTSLEQVSFDPFAFYNSTSNHKMGFVYQYEYYNHRLNLPFSLTAFNECPMEKRATDPYYHNKCFSWQDQSADYCADFDISERDLPDGLSLGRSVEFCYGMRGDPLDYTVGGKKDWFTFDKDKRDLPGYRDYLAPKRVVDERCTSLCKSTFGMDLFESQYWWWQWFNRMDGFHSFDDICTKHMNCKAGPGHINP